MVAAMTGTAMTGTAGTGMATRPDSERRLAYAAVLRDRLAASVAAKQRLLQDEQALEVLTRAAAALVDCLRAGGTVFFCGNGGSSTDCEHLSAELLGRFYRDRPALPSVNLSSNTAAMTAIANDYSYAETFSRQLAGLGRRGDVLVALSTSGGSGNVLRAVQKAAELGMTTVGFTGAGGGALAGLVDHAFRAPSTDTPRVQECHVLAGHTLCEIVENELWPAP